jgi:hypothetical protein
MTWDLELLSLEVAVEFARMRIGAWDRIEEQVWTIQQFAAEGVREKDRWWAKTARGRLYSAEYRRAHEAALKAAIVAVRACVACGKPFELSAYREQRARDRVCSTQCRGAARRNIERVVIGGLSKTLTDWADHYGLPLGTVWMRRKRGWDVERALKTPLTFRGERRAA